MAKTKEVEKSIDYNPKPKFKYLCPACTNEAMYVYADDVAPANVTCPVCGATRPYDESRLVALPTGFKGPYVIKERREA